ncbi:MAG TPA: type IV secretion system protein [Steroidobacteraceae bacterium]|nr:type IV secretion system protein [Steroidobacteraceae bacterium]
MSNSVKWVALALGVVCGLPGAARAQFAVIDVASLSQLVSEVQVLEQQLATARGQLTQAQSEFQSITGARGMARLLGGSVRNYLPPDWGALQSALQGPGLYAQLGRDVQNALQAASILTPVQLAALSPAGSAQLLAARQSVALRQSLARESLANASGRFAALQQLIDAITPATDQKAILELQARIAGEQNMLQNEHTKQQVLYEGLGAEELGNAQRARELALAGHGQFANRFQPQP